MALLGTLTGWSIAVSAALMGLVSVLIAYSARSHGVSLGSAHGALALVTAYTALQVLPLPIPLIELIAPLSLPDPRDTARALGDALPAFGTITRSSTDTLRELVKAAAICAVFFAATALTQLSGRRVVVLAAVAGPLTAAIITLGHVIADADSVYGFYAFPLPVSLMGPIGNQNHLSGFLAMSVPALLGLAIDEESQRNRTLLGVGALLCGGMALAAISRGGALSLLAGLVLLAALLGRRAYLQMNRVLLRRSLTALAVLGTAAIALSIAAYAFGDLLAQDFGGSATGKLELAAEGLVLLGESPWLGVGRGAFRVAFVDLHGHDRMYFPENLLVQWSTEWGVPVALAMVVTISGALLNAIRRAESATQLGALSAVAAMALHDQVDFALENLAIACASTVLLAAGLGSSQRVRSSPGKTASESPRWRRAQLLAPAAVALGLALSFGWHLHLSDARRLERRLLALSDERDWSAVDDLGRNAMRWHPSEPVFPLIMGWAASSRDERDAPRWLNRAMALAPDWPSPHLITARWLARRGRFSQAWLEVREAERVRASAGNEEICLFIGLTDDASTVIRVFEGEATRESVLARAAACPGAPDEVGEALDRVLLEGAPDAIESEARVRLAQRALADGSTAEALTLLDGADPHSWRVRFVRANVLLTARRPAEAVALLEEEAPLDTEPARLEFLARAQADAGNADAMRAAMEELRAFAAGSGPRLAANAILLGRLEEQLGNPGRAYQAYDDANRLDPTSTALARTAALATREGDLRRAYLALAQICRAQGPDSPECAAADAARRGAE